jgi:hypothetical protein
MVTATENGIKYFRCGKYNRPWRVCFGVRVIDNEFHDYSNVLELMGKIFYFVLPRYWHVLC